MAPQCRQVTCFANALSWPITLIAMSHPNLRQQFDPNQLMDRASIGPVTAVAKRAFESRDIAIDRVERFIVHIDVAVV
jgi:hypothetical protein